jgi:hypothetical protein
VKAVTDYVARRLIERERALDDDPNLVTRVGRPEAVRARRRWRRRELAVLAVGFVLGLIAFLLTLVVLASRF